MKILGFGKKDESKQTIDELVAALDGTIGAKALGRLVDPGKKDVVVWALVLLGQDALHLIFGEGDSWLRKMFGAPTKEQQLVSIPLEDMVQIERPSRRSWLGRVMQGPMEVVTIRMRDGDTLRVEMDRRESLVEELDRRLRHNEAG